VIHHVEIVFHVEQMDKGGYGLADGKSGQRVFIAHHQQLTHLDGRLQLLTFVGIVLHGWMEGKTKRLRSLGVQS
jgi:hypothetical protein